MMVIPEEIKSKTYQVLVEKNWPLYISRDEIMVEILERDGITWKRTWKPKTRNHIRLKQHITMTMNEIAYYTDLNPGGRGRPNVTYRRVGTPPADVEIAMVEPCKS